MDAVKDVVVRVSTSCRKWLEGTRRLRSRPPSQAIGSHHMPSHTASEQAAAMQQTWQQKTAADGRRLAWTLRT
jgi:hypothetical protein